MILIYSFSLRIPWNTKVESYSQAYQGKGTSDDKIGENGENNEGSMNEIRNNEGEDEGEEEEEEEEEQAEGYTLQQMQLHAKMVTEETEDGVEADNSCQLLWQGIQSKRTFTGFKFQVNEKLINFMIFL